MTHVVIEDKHVRMASQAHHEMAANPDKSLYDPLHHPFYRVDYCEPFLFEPVFLGDCRENPFPNHPADDFKVSAE